MYSDRDLEALEQIVALKFIGVPLRKISVLRRATPEEFAGALRTQRKTLEGKKRHIDQAIGAILEAEVGFRNGKATEASLLTRIIVIVEARIKPDEDRDKFELVNARIERLRSMSPEARAELRKETAALHKEMKLAAKS